MYPTIHLALLCIIITNANPLSQKKGGKMKSDIQDSTKLSVRVIENSENDVDVRLENNSSEVLVFRGWVDYYSEQLERELHRLGLLLRNGHQRAVTQ